jgi:hypothetical protein
LTYLYQDDVELLLVINALNGCILSVVVWLVDGMHSNNTPAADLPVQMELATPFHKPRNTSHGGGAHFWVGAISIAACRNCLNSMRKRK